MSKHNNVNPDYYKVARRERPGNAVNAVAKAPKQTGDQEKARERWQRLQRKTKRSAPNT